MYFRIAHGFFFNRFLGCARSNQQCSHSSAESEILSLDAGFMHKWFIRASVLGMRDADFKLAHQARCNVRLKQDVIALTCREVFFFKNIDHGPATILHQSSTNTTLLVGKTLRQ